LNVDIHIQLTTLHVHMLHTSY